MAPPPFDCVCINLKSRKDRKSFILRQAKKAQFPLKLFKTTKHPEGGVVGCRESHVQVIQQQINKQSDAVLILEDDALFMDKLVLPEFPPDWDIIYLGATSKDLRTYNEHYNRAIECWSTHAYILRNRMYQKVVDDLKQWPHEIDRYFVEVIQPDSKYNCYILKKQLTRQRPDYSDIENKDVDYTQQIIQVNDAPYDHVPHEINGVDYTLKLDPVQEWPTVSVVTVTRNRQQFVKLMNYNFESIDYPRDKLEWIVVDDSDEPTTGFSKDARVIRPKSVSGQPFLIGQKRNMANKYARGEYIVHMDDDDYYFPCSVKSRIQSLLTTKKHCVGITKVSCLDIFNKTGFSTGSEFSLLAEASMAYSKTFWAKRQFNDQVSKGEGVLFTKHRENEIAQIPYFFVLIALTHSSNITGNLRTTMITPETTQGYHTIFSLLPSVVQEFIQANFL
jgi:hypothetical protein